MEATERAEDVVTEDTLKRLNIPDVVDAAVRMAMFKRTVGTAQTFVGNHMAVHKDTLGMEMWRRIIRNYDPANIKIAHEERTDLLRGDPAAPGRLWADLEVKLLSEDLTLWIDELEVDFV